MTPPPTTRSRLRNAVEPHGIVGVDDRLAVARPRLDVDGRRTGGDYDVLRDDSLRRAVGELDLELGRRFERRLAFDELHAVGFEERLDAVDVGVHDVALEFRNCLALDFGLGHAQSDRVRALDVTDHLADVQERFGRNASPIEADAADLVAVDADDLFAELPEANRNVIAAGPGADDRGVDLKFCRTAHGLTFRTG